MGRLFHLFPGIWVNRVFLPNFALSLWLPMAAPRGVTYTLSDYRALGPPFPGRLLISFYPFGGIVLFSPYLFLQFPNLFFPPPGNGGLKFLFGTFFLCSFIHKPEEQFKAYFLALFSNRDYGKVCRPLAKVDKSLREPRSAVRPVPGPPPPPTCFRCGWIGHYANRLRFQLNARRGATISASRPRPRFR